MDFSEKLKNKYGTNEPFFIEEIKEVWANYSSPRIFQLINEAVSLGELARFDQGVYYIPTITLFGTSKISARKVIEKRYVMNNGSVCGFYCGLLFMNSIGVTTQVPNVIEIVTNFETSRVREVVIGNQVIRLRKARETINDSNKYALQALELFNQLDLESCKNNAQTIANYFSSCGITNNDIIKYAYAYPSKAIKNYLSSGVANAIA